jgi:hypothetical protein
MVSLQYQYKIAEEKRRLRRINFEEQLACRDGGASIEKANMEPVTERRVIPACAGDGWEGSRYEQPDW